jgi:polyphosphate kinase
VGQVGAFTDGPRFTIKGAVALELRLALKARATRDIDLVVDEAGEEDLATVLSNALTDEYQGFSFRVKGDPYVMPNEAVRVEDTARAARSVHVGPINFREPRGGRHPAGGNGGEH